MHKIIFKKNKKFRGLKQLISRLESNYIQGSMVSV